MAAEVGLALQQMHATKALGPNGMHLLFFQKHWQIVYANTVLKILNLGYVPGELNHTFIVLIPKKKQVVKVGYF